MPAPPPDPPRVPRLDPWVEDALARVVGRSHVVTDPEITGPHCQDWTGRVRGATPALVRPGSSDEVAAVVDVCRAADVAIVPQGGNTGLVAGAVPSGGAIVVHLGRLAALGAVDRDDAQITAGAGATLAEVHDAAGEHGLRFTVDLAARGSATIGGMVATNAGGHHVLRFGSMRQHLTGIEAVLADGSLIRDLRGLQKDNTGYDLKGLLCGSEGTLGIVTAARLQLRAAPAEVAVALVGFARMADCITSLRTLRARLPGIEAAEFFLDGGCRLVQAALGLGPPLSEPAEVYLLVEVARIDGRGAATGPPPLVEELAAAIDECASGVAGSAIASDRHAAERLWAYRDRHTEAISSRGPQHKLDVTVPGRQIEAFVAAVPGVVARVAPAAEVWLFGHLGDGNVHVNITGVAPDDGRVDDAVLEHVALLGGSISAEHGIGRAKRRWLHLVRSPAEIDAFRAIKAALDPTGILNPGVLLPDVP